MKIFPVEYIQRNSRLHHSLLYVRKSWNVHYIKYDSFKHIIDICKENLNQFWNILIVLSTRKSVYVKIIISYFISSNIKHLSTFRIMQDYNSICITCKRWNVLFQPSLPLCINCIDIKVILNLIRLYSIVHNIYNEAKSKMLMFTSNK